MESQRHVRNPTFMGTWYSDNPQVLENELNEFLSNVEITTDKSNVRALIVPHAGYKYSGQTAAYSYSLIDQTKVDRIFILAPLHHLSTKGCLLPHCRIYKTQFYDLEVDDTVLKDLASQGTFQMIPTSHDQNEHSAELQLNFIAHVMRNASFKIVPIYVGHINDYDKRHYSAILAPYLSDPKNLFIISSDFCHYGNSFDYEPFIERANVSDSIAQLDKEAIDAILDLSLIKFERHLSYTKNTICGRHPISLFLSFLEYLVSTTKDVRWEHVSAHLLKYKRSKEKHNPGDSSVSYAAISIHITI